MYMCVYVYVSVYKRGRKRGRETGTETHGEAPWRVGRTLSDRYGSGQEWEMRADSILCSVP